MKKVTVIGGGTGTFVVLTGIKDLPYEISAIVTSMDSGGSTGKLRDQYGVLPPGDLRQCLVALSEASEMWRKLFLYRFEKGDFEGHNFGNIFLTALEQVSSPDYQQVIDMASYILQTKGKVIPVTFDRVHLCAQYEDGEILESEDLIDTAFHKESRIASAYLKPNAEPNQNALTAIEEADYIIIGPGDLYTSLVPNLLVNGIREAIIKSNAKIVNIMNLMTKKGQTPSYTAHDHIVDLEKYLGREVGVIVINNETVDVGVEDYYTSHGEQIVMNDIASNPEYANRLIIQEALLSDASVSTSQSDKVLRSLQRHDPIKLGLVLKKIIQ